MADIKDRRPGGGGAKGDTVLYVDEGDGTWSQVMATFGRVWNATSLAWEKLTKNNTDGGLNVHISGSDVATGGTSSTDEAAFTAGTTTGTPAMGAFDDVAPDTLAENTVGIIRSTTNRALHVNLRDAAGAEVSVGGGTQYDEDSVHVSGDKVTMAGAVQKTADAALAADGDRAVLQVDDTGYLKVNVKAGSAGGVTHTDDAAFTPGTDDVVPAAGMFDDVTPDSVNEGDAGVLRMSANRNLYSTLRDAAGNERGANVTASNALVVDGSAVTQPVSGTVAVTEPVSVDDNGGSLTVDGTVTANAGTGPWPVTDNGGSLTVDGTVGVSGTVDTELTTGDLDTGAGTDTRAVVGLVGSKSGGGALIPGDATAGLKVDLGADNDVVVSGTVTEANSASIKTAVELIDDTVGTDGSATPTKGVAIAGQDGTNAQLIKTDTSGELQVDVLTLPAIPAGTNNIGDVDVLTLPTLPAGTNNIGDVDVLTMPTVTVQGDVAHDGTDSGNPVKVGTKAVNAFPTAVANNDRANAVSDLWGRQLVSHIDPAMQVTKNKNVTSTQTGTDVWSPTSGKKIAVTHLTVSSYGTTAGRVILWFGDNADTTFTQDTDQVLWAGSFAPSATAKPGVVIAFPVPIFNTTADRELHLTTDAAISLDICVSGYEW